MGATSKLPDMGFELHPVWQQGPNFTNLMGKQSPPQPAAPDYAAANKAAIDADIATLPQRNMINAASQLGGVYAGGRIYTGDEYDQAIAWEQKKFDDAKASGDTDALGQAEAQLGVLRGGSDFRGAGAADVNHASIMQQLKDAPGSTQAMLDLQRQFGTQFATESRNQLRAVDPTGFDLREAFGKKLGDGNNTLESLLADLKVPNYEEVQGNGPDLRDTGAAAAGRADLETQTFDELARSRDGGLDPVLRRAAEQASRARGASTGNILGDSSALQEAQSVQLAQQARADQNRGNALTLLGSGQTTSDKTNELASQSFNNAMAAIAQRNQSKQNTFGAQQGLVQQRQGARQQDLANIQSFLGLQPIVSQGAQLAGLQSGAAPFSAGVGYQPLGTNNQAGQLGGEWAGQLYGANSQWASAEAQRQAARQASDTQAAAGITAAAFMAFACKVARQVYGESSSEWRIFRYWLLTKGSARRVARYLANGGAIAAWLKGRADWSARVRLWMDERIAEQRLEWSQCAA